MSGAGRALPRRLGIGVVPAQGESFLSWVDRMAVRMGRTSISQVPDRVTAMKSGVCSLSPAEVPNRSLSGWETTSTRSPAKSSATSSTRASSRLSNP